MRILFAHPQLPDEAEMERYSNITQALTEIFGPHGHEVTSSKHLDLSGRHTPGQFHLLVVDMTDADTQVARILARNRFWLADVMMVYRLRRGSPERSMRRYMTVADLKSFIADHMARNGQMASGSSLAHSR